MTYDEKLAYQRGVNRARAKAHEQVRKALEIAKGYRLRSQGDYSNRRCDGCSRWTRGGERCLWGRCRGDFEFGTESRMWADTFVGEQERHVITTEDFACVNWIPKSLSTGKPL